ncbi:slit 2 protein [Sarcoptes scabiei]|nr:slit 2 protein [Sarcoptes scabiei]
MDSNSLKQLFPDQCSNLALKFFDCFDSNFIQEAHRLATSLSDVGIRFNPSEEFDQNISDDIAKQYQNLLYRLANTETNDELIRIQNDSKEIDEFIKSLERLLNQAESFNLDQEKFNSKRDNITKMNQEMKNLDRLKTEEMVKNDCLEKNSYLAEKKQNETLRKEIESLENDLQGFIEIDPLSEEKLDEQIRFLELKYRQFYSQDVL